MASKSQSPEDALCATWNHSRNRTWFTNDRFSARVQRVRDATQPIQYVTTSDIDQKYTRFALPAGQVMYAFITPTNQYFLLPSGTQMMFPQLPPSAVPANAPKDVILLVHVQAVLQRFKITILHVYQPDMFNVALFCQQRNDQIKKFDKETFLPKRIEYYSAVKGVDSQEMYIFVATNKPVLVLQGAEAARFAEEEHARKEAEVRAREEQANKQAEEKATREAGEKIIQLYDECKRMQHVAGGRRLVCGLNVSEFVPRADPDLYTRIENEFKVADQEEKAHVEIFYKQASHRSNVYRTELNVSSQKPYFRVPPSWSTKSTPPRVIEETHVQLCATIIKQPDDDTVAMCADLNKKATNDRIVAPFPHNTGFMIWKRSKRFMVDGVAVILTRVYDMTPSVIYRDLETFSQKVRPSVFPMFPLRRVDPSYYEISMEGPSAPETFFRACVKVLLCGYDIEKMPDLNGWLHDPDIRARRDARLEREIEQQRRRVEIRDQQRRQEQRARRAQFRRRRLLNNVTLRM